MQSMPGTSKRSPASTGWTQEEVWSGSRSAQSPAVVWGEQLGILWGNGSSQLLAGKRVQL